jgi:hypothetical protein
LVEWKRSDPASSLPLILQQATPLANGKDKSGEHIDEMDKFPILMPGTPFVEEVGNDDTLITDTEESGSRRMGALTKESEDEDDLIGLWGLPPGLSNETPLRAPDMLKQRAETQAQAETPGADED